MNAMAHQVSRATFTKGRVQKGDHVLVTGIGGGVALFALQFAVAAGANVYVTSSSPEKIRKAVELGAKGGVNYKDRKCSVCEYRSSFLLLTLFTF